MPYTRTYKTTVPVDTDADLAVLRWLARESFERTATNDALAIISYTETEVPASEIPPKIGKVLPKPLTDYRFFRFVATATTTISG